jgi:phosphatidylglycerol:prolipoprotein diacylglycerol transferase
MLTFPDISPVAVQIGPLAIRWYALAYIAGILLGQRAVMVLNRRMNPPLIPDKAIDDLILYAVLGIIAGGRIGYVLFYNLSYYLDNPADIAAVWHGGMSFHGGFLGVLIAFYFFARRYQISWLSLMDVLAAVTPIGLFFGRLANFVNGELYGRVADPTKVPWAMVFPRGGPEPRHPSQLYEAGLEGLVLFALVWFLATRTNALQYRGRVGGIFVAGYGIARFIIEFFREPDAQLGTLAFGLSMGQWLCLPMVVAGLWLSLKSRKWPVSPQR